MEKECLAGLPDIEGKVISWSEKEINKLIKEKEKFLKKKKMKAGEKNG